MIEVSGLGKVFIAPGGVRDLLRGRLRGPAHTALAGITFQVARGQVLALVGENGAGKTTLLRILAGLLTPSEGQARIDDQDIRVLGTSSAFRRQVALVVADERSFMWALSGRENLKFFAALHGYSRADGHARADALLARVGLGAAADRRYSEYSRGMRQRLALARGLLGDPEVLLLDEPTLGLDPVGARDMRGFLRDEIIAGAGRTAIVGSNDPAEVEQLADRVLYLKAGRLDGEGVPSELARRLGLAGLPVKAHTHAAFAPSTWMWFARVLAAFLRRDLLEAARYRAAFLTRFFGFALTAVSLVFFSRFVGSTANHHLGPYGGDYLSFALCGIVAAQLQQVGVSTLANRVRMAQLMGFLEAQLSTPAPAWIVLGAHPAYELAAAFCRSVLYVLGAAVFLGVALQPNWATLALAIPLALVTFGGMGLLSAAATMITRRSNPVSVVLGGLSAMLSGVVYPVSVLPSWLADAGRLLPLTHGLELLRRGLLAGEGPQQLAGSLLALGIFALGFFSAGLALFAWALRRARADGSLSHF